MPRGAKGDAGMRLIDKAMEITGKREEAIITHCCPNPDGTIRDYGGSSECTYFPHKPRTTDKCREHWNQMALIGIERVLKEIVDGIRRQIKN